MPWRCAFPGCVWLISSKITGKAIAMNAGAVLANHEILVCIDGDALLDPQTLRWIARAFLPSNVGGMTGNPRIGTCQ